MPRTDNIKWEIKDGKCECEIMSKCSVLINNMWELDKQALGEWIGDTFFQKDSQGYINAGGLTEREMGQAFKQIPTASEAINYVNRRLAKYKTEKQVIDVFCEAAIGLKGIWDKED